MKGEYLRKCEKMYILLLMGLLGLWLWYGKVFHKIESKQVEKQVMQIETLSFIKWCIPYYESKDKGERLAGLLQAGIVVIISCMNALSVTSYREGLLIFCVTFIVCTWLIKFIVIALNWLQAYSQMISLNGTFTILAPLLILWHMPKMDSVVEIQLTLMTLLLSTFNVYGEIIQIVIGAKGHMSKAVQIKSILTWLSIILMNLYSLLVFVQFYMNAKAHHFIAAETLNKESMIDLLYYLIITFTTVGFGDISPSTNLAKVITCIIAVSGMLFTGMFMGAVLSNSKIE